MFVGIGSKSFASPVFLAPMAGITDLPFRRAVLRHGAGLVVSEMVASRELLSAGRSARARAELGIGDDRTSVQIAGNEPEPMAEAARICAGEGARIIDINFGCPAKKVTTGWSGSALMRKPDLARSIIASVVEAVDVPVTVKMRLGWDDDNRNAPEIARMAEEAGVKMIVVHGRTRCQFYKGMADWKAISEVKQCIGVPVIANGDITGPRSADAALTLSGADGVMIGRGAQGRPWLLAQVAAALEDRPAPSDPEPPVLADIILTHYDEILSFYGRDLGVRIARKHLGWYLERLDGAAELRARVLRQSDPMVVMHDLESGIQCCNSSSLQDVA